MIQQGHSLQPKPAVSIEAATPFDVLWGKPLFRAPNLPVAAAKPAEVPFTAHRVTESRRTAK